MWNKSNGYISGEKTVWRLILITSTHSKNSQELKCFFWLVSTLFKDLSLVVSIQTNHMYHVTSTQLRDHYFPKKDFSSCPCWFFIYGGECCRPIIDYTVLYKPYFWHTRLRPDDRHVIGPDHWVRFWGVEPTTSSGYEVAGYHIITTSLPGCRTAFLRRCLVLDRPNTSS